MWLTQLDQFISLLREQNDRGGNDQKMTGEQNNRGTKWRGKMNRDEMNGDKV
jgi:hypothetical protein